MRGNAAHAQDDEKQMRTAIGMFVLLLFIPVYIVAVVWLAAQLVEDRNVFIQTIYYVVAGVLWAWPAIWLITWIKKPR